MVRRPRPPVNSPTADPGEFRFLRVEEVVPLPDLQMRAAGVSERQVRRLLAALRKDTPLPPVEVRLVGGRHLLTAGFHTLEAYRRDNRNFVTALLRAGSYQDAVLDAIGANQEPG